MSNSTDQILRQNPVALRVRQEGSVRGELTRGGRGYAADIGTVRRESLSLTVLSSRRCHRLNKPCSAQTPAPPRKRKAPRPTRVAELEKRLEDLTARVELRQVLSPTPPNLSSSIEGERPPRKMAKHSHPALEGARSCTNLNYIFTPERLDAESRARLQDGSYHQGESPESDDSSGHTDVSASERPSDGEQSYQESPPPWRSTSPASRMPPIFLADNVIDRPPNSRRHSPVCAPRASGHQRRDSNPHRGDHTWMPEPFPGETPWYYPSTREAERLLKDFNTRMAPMFPFVLAPRGVASVQLRRERPFLWKAIMVTELCMDTRRQVSLGNELLSEVVASGFLHPRKSLDLLQALELLVAW